MIEQGGPRRAIRTSSYLKRPSCLVDETDGGQAFLPLGQCSIPPRLPRPPQPTNPVVHGHQVPPQELSPRPVSPDVPSLSACQLNFKTLPLVDEPRRRQVMWDCARLSPCANGANGHTTAALMPLRAPDACAMVGRTPQLPHHTAPMVLDHLFQACHLGPTIRRWPYHLLIQPFRA